MEVDHQGKLEKVPLERRICYTCNVLEDEHHFVIECSRYTELQRKYIKSYLHVYVRPNAHIFFKLIQSTNANIVENLALFVYKAFKERNKYAFV